MTRVAISHGQLYRLLNDAWHVERPVGCVKCRMPLPMLASRSDAQSANWRIGVAPWCPHQCHAVIVDIARRFLFMYDLSDFENTIESCRRES